jgi:hypothetical protein
VSFKADGGAIDVEIIAERLDDLRDLFSETRRLHQIARECIRAAYDHADGRLRGSRLPPEHVALVARCLPGTGASFDRGTHVTHAIVRAGPPSLDVEACGHR